jgi:hypothetical protein
VAVGTAPDNIYVSVAMEKWQKTKSEIARLRQHYVQATTSSCDHLLEIKMLEQVAGFLNHVARAYPLLHIYLNGIYATMNVWRPDRDKEGWKTGEEKVEYDT